MTHHQLAKLLNNKNNKFSFSILQLEKLANNSKVDLKIIASIKENQRKIMDKLNLDMLDSTAEEVYYALISLVKDNSNLKFLYDSDYTLALFGNKVVSFNLIDIIENYHHQLKFEDRIVTHGKRALEGEIVNRYFEQIKDVDKDMIKSLAIDAEIIKKDHYNHKKIIDYVANTSNNPSILAIGEIFTDAFIELDEDIASIYVDKHKNERLSIPFGSKQPYKKVDVIKSVGPAPNAAISFSKLGLNVSLMSFLGNDETGKESIKNLENQSIDTSLIEIDDNAKSNYYYVLRLGAERTILIKNEKYKYIFKKPEKTPDWVYLALLSEDSWDLHVKLLSYLKDNPTIKLAFQPGTFHFMWGKDRLKDFYKRSFILILNKEEAQEVAEEKTDDIIVLLDKLHNLGPKVVVITDGVKGAYAYSNGKHLKMPNYPDIKPPVDRTGAGDAFASTIVAALALSYPIEVALSWAPINSMNVVQHIGAQAGLLNITELKKFLKNAPDDYKIKSLD